MLMHTYHSSYRLLTMNSFLPLLLWDISAKISKHEDIYKGFNAILKIHTLPLQAVSIWTVLLTLNGKESSSFLVPLPTMKSGLNVMILDQSPEMMIQTPSPITVNGSSVIDIIKSGFQCLRSFNCPKHLSPCFPFTPVLKVCPEELQW